MCDARRVDGERAAYLRRTTPLTSMQGDRKAAVARNIKCVLKGEWIREGRFTPSEIEASHTEIFCRNRSGGERAVLLQAVRPECRNDEAHLNATRSGGGVGPLCNCSDHLRLRQSFRRVQMRTPTQLHIDHVLCRLRANQMIRSALQRLSILEQCDR